LMLTHARHRAGDVPPAQAAQINLKKVDLPKGFSIHLFHSFEDFCPRHLENSRMRGVTYVSETGINTARIVALVDTNGDLVGDRMVPLAAQLTMPTISYWKGDLFVAEPSKLSVIRNVDEYAISEVEFPPPLMKLSDLPVEWSDDESHLPRSIVFDANGTMFMNIGVPWTENSSNWVHHWNNTHPSDYYGKIVTLLPPYTQISDVFATGVRNAVGLAFDRTGRLWLADNGRTGLGSHAPPDELNVAETAGIDFGYPYCHGCCISEPDLDHAACPGATRPPALALDAHSAPLGMSFYEGPLFPEKYHGDLFIAEHGARPSERSWPPTGYKVTRVVFDKKWQFPIRKESFADFTAFQRESDWSKDVRHRTGNLVDVLVLENGAMLVSDDLNKAIYVITYHS